jgi:hypothetical protein
MNQLALTIILSAMALSTALADEEGAKLTVSREDCRKIIKHLPAPDVVYKPGVDAYGRKVLPADIGGGSTWQPPESVTIDIDINLAEKYGVGAGGKFKGEAKIATVTVNTKTGEVTLDGKPVGDAAETAIAKACRDTYGR